MEEEYRLFQRLFNILNATFPKPDLLVYLHRSADNLMANIRKRTAATNRRLPGIPGTNTNCLF